MIELLGVSKKFASTAALNSVDLQLPTGTTTVLIGPSGCGKSTLLRLVIGLIPPDSGRILLDGNEIHPANIMALRRRMGYVIQEGGLFPHLTVRANVTIMARYLKWEQSRIERRLEELAETAHLNRALLQRFPGQLSGGERQRVSLMRALMLDPGLLLLDEPLGALDPMIRAVLQSDLKGIFKSLGKTVLLVTHDLGEAAFLGEKVVLMNEGRIVQRGSPEELVKKPADPFVTAFINAQRSPWLALHPR